MAKSVSRSIDSARTDLLAIEKLFVVKDIGDADNYVAWLVDEIPDNCPVCGGQAFRNQKKASHAYTDYINEENGIRIISLKYEFYKYRCLNPDCRRIFAKEIPFAIGRDNVTSRLEQLIADLVIQGSSYEDICNKFSSKLSRQAVGQIFNRWVHARDNRRKLIHSPEIIGVITGQLKEDKYVLIISCDDGIRILDILLGVDSDRIITSLRRFGTNVSKCILTDCDPTVYTAVKEALPGVLHIIPAEMWLRLVREDFSLLANEFLRWAEPSIHNKLELILDKKVADEQNTSVELKRIFAARPELLEPYKDYHYLRDVITNREFRWSINELDEWPEKIDIPFRERLDSTLLQYDVYREEICRQQEHSEYVPDNLLSATDLLEGQIRSRRNFSDEALRAAVLYSIESDLEHWQGLEIEEVIRKLNELQNGSRRRNIYDYE